MVLIVGCKSAARRQQKNHADRQGIDELQILVAVSQVLGLLFSMLGIHTRSLQPGFPLAWVTFRVRGMLLESSCLLPLSLLSRLMESLDFSAETLELLVLPKQYELSALARKRQWQIFTTVA